MIREVKWAGGHVTQTKTEERNGVPVGIVEGYIATWDLDEGLDRFHKGAFAKSLKEHKRRQNRPVRLKDHHGRTVGGFPLSGVFEDEKGLFGSGEINLDVPEGVGLFSLAKQGVISDFSIGYSVIDFEFNSESLVRDIFEAKVWEGSLVDEPMNRAAQITDVKSASFIDLPLAPEDTSWDSASAFKRVAEGDWDTKGAFLIEVDDEPLPSHLLIADIVEGKLMAVPQAIIEASKNIDGNPDLQAHLERYFLKMRLTSPWEAKEYHGIDEVKDWTPRQLERALNGSGRFSKSAAKIIAGRLDVPEEMGNTTGRDQEMMAEMIEALKGN